tara:strand:+ start:8117 stop:8356 length:240 start_codon:yes stop_codon:yes gene_type:complete
MQNAKTIIKQLEDSVKLAESEKRQTIPLVAVKSIVDVFRKDEIKDIKKGIDWAEDDIAEYKDELEAFQKQYPEYFLEVK